MNRYNQFIMVSPSSSSRESDVSTGSEPATWRIGCVSYLNSKPLIHGLDDHPGNQVHFDVPSSLLGQLLGGQVDIALCPTIDYFRTPGRLAIVPAGGICSAAQTFTVRLYSQIPLEQLTRVHVDTDSHTSVVLLQILLDRLFHVRPEMTPWPVASELAAHHPLSDAPAMLLIGDKVVTDGPSTLTYPHQLDLGQAWNKLTDLPFVFATWLALVDQPLGDLPARLVNQREANHSVRDDIAREYAPRHDWPADLARRYLCELLHYAIGPSEIQAIQTFGQMAFEQGLSPKPGPLALRPLL